MQLPLAVMFATPISSLYLFVTSNSTADSIVRSKYCKAVFFNRKLKLNEYIYVPVFFVQVDWHGLGQSDTFYSWLITLHGIGILASSVVLTALPFLSFFRLLVMFNFLVHIVSGALYAMAYEPWVLQIGYTLLGAAFGLSEIMIVSYISVTSKVQPRVEERKMHSFSVKDRYLAATLVFRTIGWPLGLGK